MKKKLGRKPLNTNGMLDKPYRACIIDKKCKHNKIYYTGMTPFYYVKIYVCLSCKNYIVYYGKNNIKRIVGYCESENRVYLAIDIGIIPEYYLRKDNILHIL